MDGIEKAFSKMCAGSSLTTQQTEISWKKAWQQVLALHRQGEVDAAISLLHTTIQQHPHSPVGWKLLGQCFLERGDLDHAEQCLVQSLNRGEDAETCYLLGCLYNRKKRFREALEHHLKALERDSRFGDLLERRDLFHARYQEEPVPTCFLCKGTERGIVWVGNQSLGARNYGVIHPIRIWVQCKTCGLIYADPRPTAEAVRQWWDRDQSGKEKPESWKYLQNDQRIAAYLRESRSRLALLEQYTDGRRLLDVGASVGIFVAACLETGWEARGVEIMDQAVSIAKHYGLPIEQGDFLECTFEPSSFDVVTLWEVIEHLHDPRPFLQKIREILRPQGIFALSTPNPESAWVRFKGALWNLWMEPTHLYYFAPCSIQHLLESEGFEVLRIAPSPRALHGMDVVARKRDCP